MTLVDSRPGIAAMLPGASAETPASTSTPTRPSAGSGRRWTTSWRCGSRPTQVAADGRPVPRALPGVRGRPPRRCCPARREALAAVRAPVGRVIVITGKYAPNARLHLDHLGLVADELVGWAWAEGKRDALPEHGVGVYVGDHPADMAAAAGRRRRRRRRRDRPARAPRPNWSRRCRRRPGRPVATSPAGWTTTLPDDADRLVARPSSR